MKTMARASIEIERKFLVSGEFRHFAKSSVRVKQGYLCSEEGRTVRIRVMDDKGYLTIKGRTSNSGMSRFEWEKEIDVQEAERLLALCDTTIDKTRYYIEAGDHTFEVDEFYGDNQGLVLAEVELASEDETFERPEWLGDEVTGDIRYYNSMLLRNPYKNW